jgi:hypothetical protein
MLVVAGLLKVWKGASLPLLHTPLCTRSVFSALLLLLCAPCWRLFGQLLMWLIDSRCVGWFGCSAAPEGRFWVLC